MKERRKETGDRKIREWAAAEVWARGHIPGQKGEMNLAEPRDQGEEASKVIWPNWNMEDYLSTFPQL